MRELMRDDRRDYRFAVIGDGPLAAWLRDQARGPLQGRMWTFGSLDRRTLAAYYASCDVFVHPNAHEPFGIGPLEAMASAVPVVLPASGGVLQYANESNAWLADPERVLTPRRSAQPSATRTASPQHVRPSSILPGAA